MAKLHFVKAARKPIPSHGIAKGDSYYWWKFRRVAKRVSKERPRRSQLTQSDFLAAMYDIEDNLQAVVLEFESKKIDANDLADACQQAADDVRGVGEETQGKFDNMPDSLQQGDTGQLLERRVEQCEEIASQLEQAESNIRDLADDEHEDGIADDARDDATSAVNDVSWDYE